MEAMFRFYSFGSGDWFILSAPEKELVKLCQGYARALKNRLDFASNGKDVAVNPMKDAAKIMELDRNLEKVGG